MATMKRYRVTFQGKNSRQHVTLQATNPEDAETKALYDHFRRQGRFDLTFDRLQKAHDDGTLTPELFKAEMEKRKRDQGRYESGELKIVSVEEVK